MYDDQNPEDINGWHIIALVFVIFVLACLATYALFNVIRAVA
jgi:hypothetical protein